MLTTDSSVVTEYLKLHYSKDDFTFVFLDKIVQEKEINQKEFNYKLLRGILPCNKNLMKWKIRINDECDVCQQQQSINTYWLSAFMPSHYGKLLKKICDFRITFDKTSRS